MYPNPLGLPDHVFHNSDRTLFTLSYTRFRESLSIVLSILVNMRYGPILTEKCKKCKTSYIALPEM